jgi:hypothetical protein
MTPQSFKSRPPHINYGNYRPSLGFLFQFSNSANGFETANIAVKVSEGQLYLVDHKIISVTLGTDWGWPGFRGGTRKPFAFNRLRLASVKNVSHALKLQCISTRVDLP